MPGFAQKLCRWVSCLATGNIPGLPQKVAAGLYVPPMLKPPKRKDFVTILSPSGGRMVSLCQLCP